MSASPNIIYRAIRPSLTLTVGITGHRDLTPDDRMRVAATLAPLLATIADRADGIDVRLLSAIAPGADQLAAEVALATGKWPVDLILPFERASYRAMIAQDSVEDAAAFDRLYDNRRDSLEIADTVVAPPADDATAFWHALRYRTLGRMIVAQSDIVVAIWNGGPPNGIGGTADVVAEALRHDRPVIRIAPATGKITILEGVASASDLVREAQVRPSVNVGDASVTELVGRAVERIAGPGSLDGEGPFDLVGDSPRRERAASTLSPLLSIYAWFEWFVLIGSRLRTFPGWRQRSDWLADGWPQHRDGRCGAACHGDARLQQLSESTDAIATARGHAYRSTYITTFLGGAAAVLIGLLGVIDEQDKPIYVALEIAALLALVLVFVNARRRRYHLRWLDARHVAEALRAHRVLGWIGFAGRRPLSQTRSWTGWLANSALAAIGTPNCTLDPAGLSLLATDMRNMLVQPQLEYHRTTHARLSNLHKRLDYAGWALLILAILFGLIYLVVWLFCWAAKESEHVKELGHVVAFVCAGAPLLAAAIAGIRFQGDFERFADRSERTEAALEGVRDRLDGFVTRAARWTSGTATGDTLLFEEIVEIAHVLAETLKADNDDWRFVYAARPNPGIG